MFPGPTLLSAITAIIEGGLNHTLELDPAGRQGLLDALTAPVNIHVTAPVPLTYSLSRVGERVSVSSQPAEQPALSISGKPIAFAALAIGDDKVFGDGRLGVDGDMGLAHQIQRAIHQLNPDWEAAMARYLGDVPAHFLGTRIRSAVSWSQNAVSALNANIEEYLHEESRSLPGRRELEATFGDIDQLHLRTERLEARLNHLENRADTDEPENP
ncbi:MULTISPECIES: SCP2 domain-containing protein [Marinobacter]|uniref:Ubiquinone biosynthesis accessory factor UbiJ n=1 Tax=Marinobacter suaedae TaxID=3057675 RepID=A0ABT8VYA3_9GAMM|nr:MULTISPECIES: SCP2 sterol-binding domain-containing protein [unclassified Marinobacter]MBZ2169109.1 SCP2 sterol-binding domain-containing protein [Marinobacter sp. F4216]MDO3720978.1 SCP2 sterol-binding domain-containing protein [Marinobacter sp. chi1]